MATPQQKAYEHAQSLLRKLEKKRQSRIFVYIEVEDYAHICYPNRSYVFSQKDQFKNVDKLEVLLHSAGGHASCAYQIAKLFRRRCKQLNIIVPLVAKSAATLMCLAGDTIYMGERAELGPLDVQITDRVEKGTQQFSPLDEFKSLDYLKEYSISLLDYYALALIQRSGMSLKEAFREAIPAVTSLMTPLYNKIDPSKIGGFRRNLAEGEEYAKRLLALTGSAHAQAVTDLVWKYPAHDFVIDRAEATSLGLPVIHLDESEDDDFFEIIMSIYEYGESIYEFTKPTTAKAAIKKRVSRTKPTPAPIAKAATP
ncbi:MAG TPA: hypothetical protein VGO50_05155 [Pyrinomonadaceae bacterium]|jgi:hypothetical protein|nr:hypothetical protein [Pyrinomonadaceae bacterium]